MIPCRSGPIASPGRPVLIQYLTVALASSVDSEEDPRAVVDAIVELNGLRSGADIRAGDVLIVPVAGDE